MTTRFDTRVREESFLMTRAEWWRKRVIYQFYPPSYFDSNADAIGVSAAESPAGPRCKSGVDPSRLLPFRQPTTACAL